jgi:hypothetical protein
LRCLLELSNSPAERMALRLKHYLVGTLAAATIVTLPLVVAFRPRPIAFNLDDMRLQGIDFIALPATNRLTFTPSHLMCWRQRPWMRVVVPANYPLAATNGPSPQWTIRRNATNCIFTALAVPRGRWDRLPVRMGRIEFPEFSFPMLTNTGFPLQIQVGYGRKLGAYSNFAVAVSPEVSAPQHFTGWEAQEKIDYLARRR